MHRIISVGFLFFLTWCMLLPLSASNAAVIRVPGNYADISEAIAKAPDGSTILVQDGLYQLAGPIRIINLGKNLYIRSQSGAASVILTGQGSSALLHIENTLPNINPEKNIVFDGFTFKDGRTVGGNASPITIANASPVFLNSIFENNRAFDKGGAVLVYGAAAHPVFTDCVFRNNSSDRWGGAVLINGNHAQATFTRCLFEGNTTRTPNTHNLMSQGGAIKFSQGGGRIIDSVFRGNSAAYAGGAIQVLNSFSDPVRDVVEIHGCIFDGNFSRAVPGRLPADPPPSEAGAVMVEDNVSVTITGSLFTNNVSNSGGGVMVYRGNLRIEDSVFEGNIADGSGNVAGGGAVGINSNDAGPPLRPNADVRLTNVLIRNNKAHVGGGIFAQGNVNPGQGAPTRGTLHLDRVVLDNNLATRANNGPGNGGGIFLDLMDATARELYTLNNHAENYGGAVVMVQSSQFAVVDSYVVGNSAAVADCECHPFDASLAYTNTIRAFNGGVGSANLSRLVAIPARSFTETAYLTYLNLPNGAPTLQPGGSPRDLGAFSAGSLGIQLAETTTFDLVSQHGTTSVVVPKAYRSTAGRAFGGVTPVLPTVLEAENFDTGGHRLAYFDRTASNEGGAYRPGELVDIFAQAGANNGHAVGRLESGEWLDYSFYAKEGIYSPSIRVAAPASGGSFYLSLNGEAVTDIVSVPNTGGAASWHEIRLRNIALPDGFHVLRFVCVQGGFNFDAITFRKPRSLPGMMLLLMDGD